MQSVTLAKARIDRVPSLYGSNEKEIIKEDIKMENKTSSDLDKLSKD